MSSGKIVFLVLVALIAVLVWQALYPATVLIGDDLFIGDASKLIIGIAGVAIGAVALLLAGVLLTGVFLGLSVVFVGLFLLLLSIPVAMALPILLPLLLLAGVIHLIKRSSRDASLPRSGDKSALK